MRPVSMALAALVVAGSLAISPNFRTHGGEERTPYAGDFLHEWVGGWIVRAGDRARLYDREYYTAIEHDPARVGFRLKADRYLPMVYPPVYYLVVSPLSRLPYRAAAWVWAGVSLASFAVAMALLARLLAGDGDLARAVPATAPRSDRIGRIAGLLALPAAVTFLPFAENLVSSQKGAFVLLALTGALVALRADRPILAGLALGAVAVKPQLAIVVPAALLAKGAVRVALGAAIAAGTLLAGSIAMGDGLALAYARFAASAGDYIRFGPGYRHRLHGLYAFWTVLAGEPTPFARVATAASAAVVVLLLVHLLRGRLDVRSPRFLVQFAGLVLATILLCPHVLTYDLTILLLPMGVLGWLVLRGGLPARARRPILWLTVALYVGTGVSAIVAERTGVQVTSPILLGLLAVLAMLPERWDVARRDAGALAGS